MTRNEALALLKDYRQSESLFKRAFAVEAAMRQDASHFGSVMPQ